MTNKIVAFVVYPGLTPLDLMGPLQVMTGPEVAEAVYGMQPRAIEYDPHPPHGGIDWGTVDRDSFAGRVEGFAHQALDEHPAMLARVLGRSETAG